MAQLAIKGHAIRGKEVIEILEMFGGKNTYWCDAIEETHFYFIVDGEIDYDEERHITDEYAIFTLEQFLEKFPYKVGDKAFAFGNKCTIIDAVWDESIDEVVYTIKLDTSKYTTTKLSNQLQPYKEETMEPIIKMNPLEMSGAQCIIPIPKGYEFAIVDDDNQQVIFEKIGCQYPKTYEECCKVLGRTLPINDDVEGYKWELIMNFQRLLVSRNAYWKLAGEQMGLGKPWEPDWRNEEDKYCIVVDAGDIRGNYSFIHLQHKLSFPTAEMRDACYENLKELIEKCKELL